jgi:hypothetical protein
MNMEQSSNVDVASHALSDFIPFNQVSFAGRKRHAPFVGRPVSVCDGLRPSWWPTTRPVKPKTYQGTIIFHWMRDQNVGRQY